MYCTVLNRHINIDIIETVDILAGTEAVEIQF